MSTPLCQHGYVYGTCPHGCKPPTSAEQIPQWEDKEPPAPETDELKCAICGHKVIEGTVYKGRPICNDCREGMKGEK